MQHAWRLNVPRTSVVGILCLASAAAGCHPSGSSPEVCSSPQPVPGAEWDTATPEAEGLSSTALQAAADYAGTHSSQCMVVIRHGRLVGEWYWGGATPTTAIPTWSVAKSYTSTLVGLAIDAKKIGGVSDPAQDYVQWVNTGREKILIANLLSATSGLQFDTEADSVTLLAAQNQTAQAIALLPAGTPGTLWQYSNQAVQIFDAILNNATGEVPSDFAQEKLWGPLGMNATWATDPTGHPTMYANVLASCRDHARFGQLMLRQGCWGSERIISSGWVTQASHPSQSLNEAYGYLWWLNAGAPVLDSVTFDALPTTSFHPYAPPDAFCASGLGSQMIEVIPSLDLVVVRAGYAPQNDPSLASNPVAQFEAVASDGRQIFHNGVLERVLAGVLTGDAGVEVADAGVEPPDAGAVATLDGGVEPCGPSSSWGTPCGVGEICNLSRGCVDPVYSVSNGVVTDGATGLAWQQAPPASPCPSDGSGGCTFADAQAYCQSLSLPGYTSGWHLPAVAELYSIVQAQPNGANPTIDTSMFPGTPPRWFWTSSSQTEAGVEVAWVVYFYDGGSGYLDGASSALVRCVHD